MILELLVGAIGGFGGGMLALWAFRYMEGEGE